MRNLLSWFLAGSLTAAGVAFGAATENTAADPAVAIFSPLPAPKAGPMLLHVGDRLAICGDSITEQRMYSRLIEDYLTACLPELKVTVRQFGWSGERASGFLSRMTNDCLRFKPTIATTCYGMNDHEYRPYENRIGVTYCENSLAIIEAFRSHGARVVLGSPGCVGKMPSWVKTASGTVDDLNLSLCTLRNLDIEMAAREGVTFADVFWPMVTGGAAARRQFSPEFAIAGRDGVHPGWAGQAVMAYAYLKAMGIPGEIGLLKADLKSGGMEVSAGHQLVSAQNGVFVVRSQRYPFCACVPPGGADNGYPVCGKADPGAGESIQAAMALVPFNHDLNRFTLVARHASAAYYRVTWGGAEKVLTGRALTVGVNLAELFPLNPFSAAFAGVDAAVAAKQAFETHQIKDVFHGGEGKAGMEAAVARTEKEREPLARAVAGAVVPVTHELRIEPL